ncbi:MAG: hypothetical protein J0M16_07145, partial [Gammaproteobacteria bacterium]|nr:hypothetical protein [Gammaproteobacteria bacterium]
MPIPPPRGASSAPSALTLAARHRDAESIHARIRVRPEVKRDLKALREAWARLNAAATGGQLVTPAAQWILDNFHLVSTVGADLPVQLNPDFVDRLPAVHAEVGSAGPRLRMVAILDAWLRQEDYRLDVDHLQGFLRTYQTVTPLRMAELWAISPLLRLLLFRQLARLAGATAQSAGARALADRTAEALLHHADRGRDGRGLNEAPPVELPADPLFLPFAAQLVERLRHRGEDGRPALTALALALESRDCTLEDAVRQEHNRQSAHNVRASNLVNGLRTVAATDWRSVFEALSLVEQELQTIPGYATADRATRETYRRTVTALARASGRAELAVAGVLGGQVAAAGGGPLAGDIGWHLVDGGRPALEAMLGAKPGPGLRLRRWLRAHAAVLYPGVIGAGTTALTALVMSQAFPAAGFPFPLTVVLVAVLAAFPASELVIRLLNAGLGRLYPARHLPRLALDGGIPESARTLVVVPMMLGSLRAAEHAVRELEVHYLANADPALRFAMLSDWPDADTPLADGDEALVEHARHLVAELNGRYPLAGEPRFHLLHRRRVWSDGEQCWMGWERKRGKLAELNRLLLGTGATTFLPDPGGTAPPAGVRFVLTLDADSRLPIGAVQKLVGSALHPLNTPRWDPVTRRVDRGFGILQPRVSPLLANVADRSLFQWAMAGSSGIDPYAGAVSDVYQDFMGTGIFAGKGLYDVRVFEQALQGRVPENAVLSHDLLEGLYARCCLVSDVEIYEEFPSHSEVAAARAHRWTRGDWQLLPWLAGRYRGDIPLLGAWQLFDNLRRSLLAPACMALFLAAWCVPSAARAVLLALMLSPFIAPVAVAAATTLAASGDGLGWWLRL